MTQSDVIRHPGRIENIEGTRIQVRILASSGCASCYVKGACNMAEMEKKSIDVMTADAQSFSIGQSVMVQMSLSTGTRAVMLGYIIPLLLLLCVMVAVYSFTGKDGLAGLMGLSILLPYYSTLYLFREKLKRKTVFTLVPEKDAADMKSCPT